MFPGSYLLASMGLNLRRKYLNPRWASVAGVLAQQRTFFVCQIGTLIPDPSPQIPRRNNTGTLRIFPQDDVSEWYVDADNRDHDGLGGIGASGGFWTAINGVFVAIFGSGLLWVITGSKPLSNFGLINGGESTKAQLRRSFPDNEGDGAGIDVDRFIQRRLRASVNCGPFEHDSEEETSSTDGDNMELVVDQGLVRVRTGSEEYGDGLRDC